MNSVSEFWTVEAGDSGNILLITEQFKLIWVIKDIAEVLGLETLFLESSSWLYITNCLSFTEEICCFFIRLHWRI